METIYPNLYIVLVGPAAQTRKSTALRIGESIFKELQVPIIGQDNSPEAVIRDIKNSQINFFDGPTIRFQSAVVCFASELAVFLRKQDTEFQAYLTDWYDSPNQWKRTTKHQGVDDVTGLCFNLIGAMAPDWIPHVFVPESIGGGFTSRIMFVSESKKAQTVANPNKVLADPQLREDLIHDLERIRNIIGEFHFSPAAEAYYEQWYTKDDGAMQEGTFIVPDPSFHTYCGRRATLIKKVSICLAASRGDERIVQLDDVKLALEYMTEAEGKMKGLFASVGRGPLSHQTKSIVTMLETRKKMKRSALLREMQQDLTLTELEGIEKTLEATKQLKVTRLTEEGDILYEWIPKPD